MSIFGFKSKKGEVLNHWISFVDGFSFPAHEFYSAVEKELDQRKIPKMEMSRIDFAEGGLLSDKRTYLRMIRERLAFDTCAAPFGNIYFFSCRTVFIPPVVKIWHIVVLLLCFGALFVLFTKYLGMIVAAFAVLGLMLAVTQVLQNVVAMGLADLDATLMKIPALGPIYECWFRKETYYREDTRLLFLKILPDLVKELAEETVAVKGLKLMEQYQRAPILGDLYKPLAPTKAPEPDSRYEFGSRPSL